MQCTQVTHALSIQELVCPPLITMSPALSLNDLLPVSVFFNATAATCQFNQVADLCKVCLDCNYIKYTDRFWVLIGQQGL